MSDTRPQRQRPDGLWEEATPMPLPLLMRFKPWARRLWHRATSKPETVAPQSQWPAEHAGPPDAPEVQPVMNPPDVPL